MPVTKSLVDSSAWRALSDATIRVYILIYLDCKRFEYGKDKPGSLGGQLTYAQAEAQGINRTKLQRAIKELRETGFIKVQQTGGFYRKNTYFTLINDWRNK